MSDFNCVLGYCKSCHIWVPTEFLKLDPEPKVLSGKETPKGLCVRCRRHKTDKTIPRLSFHEKSQIRGWNHRLEYLIESPDNSVCLREWKDRIHDILLGRVE